MLTYTCSSWKKNNDLLVFLQWYNSTNQEPNITTLGMSGLPAGRGRKGGIPRRKRSAAARRQPPEIVVNRPATRPASSKYFLLPLGSSSASSISSRSISGSLSTFSGALQSIGFEPPPPPFLITLELHLPSITTVVMVWQQLLLCWVQIFLQVLAVILLTQTHFLLLLIAVQVSVTLRLISQMAC